MRMDGTDVDLMEEGGGEGWMIVMCDWFGVGSHKMEFVWINEPN